MIMEILDEFRGYDGFQNLHNNSKWEQWVYN